MGFDGSSITGFNAIEESDMVAIPDPTSFRLMPSREGRKKVGRMICDIVTPDGESYDGDPRHVLRQALDRMQSMGFDTFNVGPELEYFLFRDAKSTEVLDEAYRRTFEACGVRNILTKTHGSTNPINLVKATIQGLLMLRTREDVARLRGVAL